MKNLDKSLAILGGVAAVSMASAALVVGCSGDDTTLHPDGGQDASSDTSVVPDSQPADVQPVDMGVMDGGNPYDNYRTQVAAQICARFAACCGQLDAGNFDTSRCIKGFTITGWGATDDGLGLPGVTSRGHLSLDNTSAQSCLAALATISCPIVTSTEYKSITSACNNAISGTQTTGGDCAASIECKTTDYCNFDVDGGVTEAGVPLGKCTTLIDSGVNCGQGYFGNLFSSEECSYKSGPSPARFCQYDTYPTKSGYICANLRPDNQLCYYNNECQSGLCVDPNPPNPVYNCAQNNCKCGTSVNLGGYVCGVFAPLPKDGGTD